jgi:hypothetical protein
VSAGGLTPGTPVLVYLHTPREKVFGVLLALQPAGVSLRGIDLTALDDFVRQEARRETGLALVTLFYPMNRVERLERDETLGGIEGIADRFRRETGRSIQELAGFGAGRGLSSRRKRR